MLDQNTQPQPNTSGDKSAAALSFATMLSEQLMPKVQPEEVNQEMGEGMPPEAPQTPETAPGEEMMPESEEMPMEATEEPVEENNLSKEFEGFKGEVKGIIETKFDDLIKTIKETLKSE